MIVFWMIAVIFPIYQEVSTAPLSQDERNLHFNDRRREPEESEYRTRRPVNRGSGSNIENIFKIPIAVIKGTSAAAQAFYPQNTETINKIFDIPVMTLDAVGNYVKERPQRPGLNIQDDTVEQNPIRFGNDRLERRRDERRERIMQLREQERLERERRRMMNQDRLERDRRRLMDQESFEHDRRRLMDQENLERDRRRLMDQANLEHDRRQSLDQANLEHDQRQPLDQANLENDRRQSLDQGRFFLGGGHHSIGLYDVASAFADLLVGGGGHGHHHGHGQIFGKPPKRPLKPIKPLRPLKPHKPHKPGHLGGIHGGLLGGNGGHGGNGGNGANGGGYEVHEQFEDTPFQSSGGTGIFSWLQTTFQADPSIGHPKIQNKIAPGSEFRNDRDIAEFRTV